jgi:hypothetical protein
MLCKAPGRFPDEKCATDAQRGVIKESKRRQVGGIGTTISVADSEARISRRGDKCGGGHRPGATSSE